MNRRDFCRKAAMIGGALILSPLVEACSRPETSPPLSTSATLTDTPLPTATNTPPPTATATNTPSPTATASPVPIVTYSPEEMTQVALVKTTDRAYGVRRAIELLGINPARGSHVLLKPNFNTADPAPASTHPDVLREFVIQLFNMGSRSIMLAERSGQAQTRKAMEKIGVFDLASELGFGVTVLDELRDDDTAWVMQLSEDFHWQRGFPVPKLLLDAECVVQACCLKTHQHGGHFTMSLKNSVGYVPDSLTSENYGYMNELHGPGKQRARIAEINTVYDTALIVLDGVDAFKSGGPEEGRKVSPEVVLAGTDRIAIDAVGVTILRMFGAGGRLSQSKAFEQDQIARAVELGLGIDVPGKIDFVTGDPESEAYVAQIKEVLMQ